MICAACQNGTLEQKYPDTIECNMCKTKWKNSSLGNYNTSRKAFYSAKYRRGRSF